MWGTSGRGNPNDRPTPGNVDFTGDRWHAPSIVQERRRSAYHPAMTTQTLVAWCGVLARVAGVLVAVMMAMLAGGCRQSVKPTFDSPEPAARNAAIVHAASSNDQTAIPDLVRLLESDDPATRLLAITTLERLTGETHGYIARDRSSNRAVAVKAWQDAIAASLAIPLETK